MIAVIVWTAFTVPSRRPMCPVTPYVWIAMCTMPECTVTRWSAPNGSATTAASVRRPLSIR